MTRPALEAPPQAPATDRFKEKRETLLAAASAQFNKYGVKGTTLAGIAASVGLVTTSVTYYYRKKEDLATACILRSIAANDDIARRAAEAGSVGDRITRFVALHAQSMAAIDRGDEPPLMYFNDIRALPQPHAQKAFAAYTDMFRSVRRFFSAPAAGAAPALSAASRNARTHLLLTAAHNMRAWVGQREIDAYPRAAAHVADLLLHGLAGDDAAAWPPQGEAGDAGMALGAPVPGKTEAFLRTATELVNDKGYRGASIDEIASRLNVTKGSFYYDNDTKLDLVTACVERSFSILRGALQHAESAPGPALRRLVFAVAGLVRFQLSERGPLLRTSAEIALPDEQHRESVRRTYQRLVERITDLIVEGMADGSIRPCHPGIAAQLVASAVNAAAELPRWTPALTVASVDDAYTHPALFGLLVADQAPSTP